VARGCVVCSVMPDHDLHDGPNTTFVRVSVALANRPIQRLQELVHRQPKRLAELSLRSRSIPQTASWEAMIDFARGSLPSSPFYRRSIALDRFPELFACLCVQPE
jgi:hypothetical protein